MNRLRTACLIALLWMVTMPAVCGADEYYPAFLIIRYFADESVAERNSAAAAHHAHLAAEGRIMASFRVLDDDGNPIGIGSWSAFDSEGDARAFVERDPYYQAGLYKDVSIVRTNLYLLDKWFAIVPEWRNNAGLEASHRDYERLIKKKTRAPR